MPDYQASLQQLHQRFLARLPENVTAIDNLLAQQQKAPLARADFIRAHGLVHNLAGSGTIFGFPEVSAAGQIADAAIATVIAAMTEDSRADDAQFTVLQQALLQVRETCQTAVAKELATP